MLSAGDDLDFDSVQRVDYRLFMQEMVLAEANMLAAEQAADAEVEATMSGLSTKATKLDSTDDDDESFVTADSLDSRLDIDTDDDEDGSSSAQSFIDDDDSEPASFGATSPAGQGRSAASQAAGLLSMAELERNLMALFESADGDGDGLLERHEFMTMLQATAIGRTLAVDQLDAVANDVVPPPTPGTAAPEAWRLGREAFLPFAAELLQASAAKRAVEASDRALDDRADDLLARAADPDYEDTGLVSISEATLAAAADGSSGGLQRALSRLRAQLFAADAAEDAEAADFGGRPAGMHGTVAALSTQLEAKFRLAAEEAGATAGGGSGGGAERMITLGGLDAALAAAGFSRLRRYTLLGAVSEAEQAAAAAADEEEDEWEAAEWGSRKVSVTRAARQAAVLVAALQFQPLTAEEAAFAAEAAEMPADLLLAPVLSALTPPPDSPSAAAGFDFYQDVPARGRVEQALTAAFAEVVREKTTASGGAADDGSAVLTMAEGWAALFAATSTLPLSRQQITAALNAGMLPPTITPPAGALVSLRRPPSAVLPMHCGNHCVNLLLLAPCAHRRRCDRRLGPTRGASTRRRWSRRPGMSGASWPGRIMSTRG